MKIKVIAHALLLVLVIDSMFARAELGKDQPPIFQAEEAALRETVARFLQGYVSGEQEILLSSWSAQSRPSEPCLLALKSALGNAYQSALPPLKLAQISIHGDQAFTRLTVENRPPDAQPDRTRAYTSYFFNLRFVKEKDAWKISGCSLAIEDFAEQILATESDHEREELLDKERELAVPQLYRALGTRGIMRAERGEYYLALRMFRSAMTIAERLNDRRGMAAMFNGIGAVYNSHGEYDRALVSLDRALSICKELGHKDATASVMNNFGDNYRMRGDYANALDYYQQSLDIFKGIKNNAGMINVLMGVGITHYLQGSYAQSLDNLQQSLTLSKQLNDNLRVAKALGSIGVVYALQGDYQRALDSLTESLKISERERDKEGIASALGNIGNCYLAQEDYCQALKHYEKALELGRAYGDKAKISTSLSNIGLVHRLEGDYEAAIRYYKESLDMSESIKDKAGVARAMSNLGGAYYNRGQYALAQRYAEMATGLAIELNNPDQYWRARHVSALTYSTTGKLAESVAALKDSISAIEGLRENIVGGEKAQQIFFDGKQLPYKSMVRLMMTSGNIKEAFVYAEHAKARVILDVLHNGKANAEPILSAAEAGEEKRLRNQIVSVNLRMLSEGQQKGDKTALENLKEQLQKARRDYEEFQTNLQVVHPELKIKRGEVSIINHDEAADLIDTDEALLEFVVTDEKTYLFVITKKYKAGKAESDIHGYEIQIRKDELAKLITDVDNNAVKTDCRKPVERDEGFRALLNHRAGFKDLGQKLYRLLLAPAEKQIAGKRSLIIIPDGVLWELPFQALQSGANRYVMDYSAVSYAPSATALRAMIELKRKRSIKESSLFFVGFGNPVATRIDGKPMPAGFVNLPEAEEEVNVIASLYGSKHSRVFVRDQATEQRLKSEAGNSNILHLATHAKLDKQNPLYSYLMFSQGQAEGGEDGFLEAWEIMNLNLKSDMVVMSACETARVSVGDDSTVMGLSWALLVAGCPTSVVSQWNVRSDSTKALMVEFYKIIKNSGGRVSKAEALRRAALKLRHSSDYNHPFYWAGFIIVGAID